MITCPIDASVVDRFEFFINRFSVIGHVWGDTLCLDLFCDKKKVSACAASGREEGADTSDLGYGREFRVAGAQY